MDGWSEPEPPNRRVGPDPDPDRKRARHRARAHAERRLVERYPEEYTRLHRTEALRLGVEPRGLQRLKGDRRDSP